MDRLYYRAMFSNGFNTLGTRPGPTRLADDILRDRLVASRFRISDEGFYRRNDTKSPVDPLQDKLHILDQLQGQQGIRASPENSDIRLTDGTLVTQPGTLAPEVTLDIYHVALGAIELAAGAPRRQRERRISYIRDLFNLIMETGSMPAILDLEFGGYLLNRGSSHCRRNAVIRSYVADYRAIRIWLPIRGPQLVLPRRRNRMCGSLSTSHG